MYISYFQEQSLGSVFRRLDWYWRSFISFQIFFRVATSNAHKTTDDVHKTTDDVHKTTDDVHKTTDDVHKTTDDVHKTTNILRHTGHSEH